MTPLPLPLLQQREIEANVIAPLFRAFAKEIGELRAREILAATIRDLAAQAGCRLLLSEDLQEGFTWGAVTVVNPFSSQRHALLNALSPAYPVVERFSLVDYRVRILDQGHGTDATVRVLIQTTNGRKVWTTVGVGQNAFLKNCAGCFHKRIFIRSTPASLLLP